VQKHLTFLLSGLVALAFTPSAFAQAGISLRCVVKSSADARVEPWLFYVDFDAKKFCLGKCSQAYELRGKSSPIVDLSWQWPGSKLSADDDIVLANAQYQLAYDRTNGKIWGNAHGSGTALWRVTFDGNCTESANLPGPVRKFLVTAQPIPAPAPSPSIR
jgi:hypothetical protein